MAAGESIIEAYSDVSILRSEAAQAKTVRNRASEADTLGKIYSGIAPWAQTKLLSTAIDAGSCE